MYQIRLVLGISVASVRKSLIGRILLGELNWVPAALCVCVYACVYVYACVCVRAVATNEA